jgi:hypothetical protein
MKGRWRTALGISWQAFRDTATFVSALTVLAAAAIWVSHQWSAHQDWRPVENRRLESLRDTYLIDKVRSDFGEPSARRVITGQYSADYFRRHNYWLQVLYETTTGSVAGWTVTVCSRDFAPRFALDGARPFQLWRTTIAEVADHMVDDTFTRVNAWKADTVHQPNQLMEYGGLPGVWNFVNLVWGVSDSCGAASTDAEEVVRESAPESFYYEGPRAGCEGCEAVDRKAVINTYGEMYSPRSLPALDRAGGLYVPRTLAGGHFVVE